MKSQQTIGLTHQPLRHSVAGFKRPSLLRHYEPLLGRVHPAGMSVTGGETAGDAPDGDLRIRYPCDGR
jgi:hypothetical protein